MSEYIVEFIMIALGAFSLIVMMKARNMDNVSFVRMVENTHLRSELIAEQVKNLTLCREVAKLRKELRESKQVREQFDRESG